MRLLCLLLSLIAACAGLQTLRPPAVPLIANSPYFSIWSANDKLTDDWTVNGPNGDRQQMAGMLAIDGVAYSFMGPNHAVNHSTDVLFGVDNSGGDLPGMPIVLSKPDYKLCQQMCISNPDCGGWAVGGTAVHVGCESQPLCWLKSVPGPLSDNRCRISQIIDRAASGLPASQQLTQLSVLVHPTTTVYSFAAPAGVGVSLNVTFWSAVLPANLEAMARPLTYVTLTAWATDGRAHDVRVYLDITAQAVVSSDSVTVAGSRGQKSAAAGPGTIEWLRVGNAVQQIFSETGDRPNWGYLYAGYNTDPLSSSTVGPASRSRVAFAQTGALPADAPDAAPAMPSGPALAVSHRFPSLTVTSEFTVALAMDVVYAINYFEQWMPPYWRRNGAEGPDMLAAALAEAPALRSACTAFDKQLEAQTAAALGAPYATLCALAYRQAYASTDIVWNEIEGTHWQFLKEISSGSCLSTVDVIYPAAPLYLLAAPDLLYRLIVPLMDYALNETYIQYNLAWAPHHLGTYPIGNLRPDQQEQMPVEETANLLIMLAAIATGSNSTSFMAPKYWPLLTSWGDYLITTALDPGNQLCTDDFEGPSPHNANLAAKGIVGLESLAILLSIKGDSRAAHYDAVARDYATKWMGLALDASRTRYKLEYDKDNTWSTKYNLLFHTALKMNLFPPSVLALENAYYAKMQNPYGLPLDNRADFAKTDWELWAAASMPRSQALSLIDAVFRFANTTTGRVPFSDWYETSSGDLHGFRCRAVIGGVFAPMLTAGMRAGTLGRV